MWKRLKVTSFAQSFWQKTARSWQISPGFTMVRWHDRTGLFKWNWSLLEPAESCQKTTWRYSNNWICCRTTDQHNKTSAELSLAHRPAPLTTRSTTCVGRGVNGSPNRHLGGFLKIYGFTLILQNVYLEWCKHETWTFCELNETHEWLHLLVVVAVATWKTKFVWVSTVEFC